MIRTAMFKPSAGGGPVIGIRLQKQPKNRQVSISQCKQTHTKFESEIPVGGRLDRRH